MNYYTTPPQLTSHYSFMFKSTLVHKAERMVEWADREYQTALNTAIEHNRWKSVKIMADEWSGMRVLSQLDGFHSFCAQLALDIDAWNKLSRKTRKFITKAMELYEGLRETTVN